uniref:Si:ch211-286b5.4 n=1 Tax=Amphilophus citrinellus TaxID=61819 RepID=A0A3Q0RMU7_AMPCI
QCAHLQLQCNQQEAELRRRELQTNKLKERLSQMTDRHREKGPALRLMLERREAELREAMKLRHSLTTLLHALRVNMEQDVAQDGDKRLDQSEEVLGEHVTGGVVQSWRKVQRLLQSILSETIAGTDQEKLLAQLEAELKESQHLVRLQQQMLQDSLASPIPSELTDSYFLEEWERLQARWAELNHMRRTFERERQSFTDAAIRLSREDFEQQKACLLKQQYLCDSPPFNKGAPNSRRESTALPSSSELGAAPVAELHQRGRVQTPSTPELYSALNLTYNY